MSEPHITAKVPPSRRHAVESSGLAKAGNSLFTCCVVFHLCKPGLTQGGMFWNRAAQLYPTGSALTMLPRPREWEDDKGSVLQSQCFLSAADFHAHIFHVYAKLLRALCKISSFSSLIPTLVHALMTLKAKGCFFRHNGSCGVSRFPRSQSAFSTPDHFCSPILWLLGSRRR